SKFAEIRRNALAGRAKGGKGSLDQSFQPKEGIYMRVRWLIPVLSSATLALFAFSANSARAGSFFGPSCYGADYTYQYPNRSHNVFGCGPGTHCQAWHGFFHRRARRNQNVPNDGMPTNGMPMNGMPVDGMPITGMPMNGMPMTGMPTQMM